MQDDTCSKSDFVSLEIVTTFVCTVQGHGVEIDNFNPTLNASEKMLKWAMARAPVLVIVGADDMFMSSDGVSSQFSVFLFSGAYCRVHVVCF